MLIAIFMVAMYRGLGLISLIGLTVYILFSGESLQLCKLPDSAWYCWYCFNYRYCSGCQCTYFCKDKRRNSQGKGKHASFTEGFRHALKAIIDSNVTTLITAAALYRFGTGPIRGFAVTLAIGVVISMFTAIVLVRAILFLVVNTRAITPGFIGVKFPNPNPRVFKEK